MTDVVYADFTDPICYLASLRVDRLLAGGLPVPDWRAVEHRPRLPMTGVRLDAAARATRDRELAEARALLQPGEQLPEAAPALLPHTGSAVAAYAEAYEAGVADLVRPLLFRAYWIDGQDIGSPEVLRRLLPEAFRSLRRIANPIGDAIRDFGYVVTSQHAPLTHQAYTRVRQWQQDWLALGAPVTLTLTGTPGTVAGERALEQLLAGLAATPASPASPQLAPALAGRR